MNDTRYLVCRNCATTNRVPTGKLRDRPKCGKCKQPLFMFQPVELNENTFQKFVTRNDIPVIIDFWAPWCGPCKMMAPEFAEAARQLEPDVFLAKLNTEDWPHVAAPFHITGIPTMVFLIGGQEAARTSGAMGTAQIVQWIRSIL